MSYVPDYPGPDTCLCTHAEDVWEASDDGSGVVGKGEASA